jgi:cell division protein FtsQ
MKGGKMPLSNNFTARVPLVSGKKINSEEFELCRVIYDEFFEKTSLRFKLCLMET